MNKSKELKEIGTALDNLRAEYRELKYGGRYKELKDTFDKQVDEYYKKIQPELTKILEEEKTLLKKRDEVRRRRKTPALELSQRLKDWLSKYSQGVDWGYGGLKIKEILDDDERFVIITNPGSTGGQGTAMGTMNYYYSRTSHWVTDTFVCDRAYSNSDHKGISSWGRIGDVEIEGRLTKEGREKLLNAVKEYKKLIGLS